MATLTLELPEPIIQQLKTRGISQQQLNPLLIRLIQQYIRHPQALDIECEGDTYDQGSKPDKRGAKTLLELRGSVPVTNSQDFGAIRQQIIQTHARKVVQHES
jgi:hypothetical protein